MIYHVSKTGNDQNNGADASPFLTISRAAKIAKFGDVVTVHEGVYRENVSPINDGVVYTAAENEKAVIKGSEIISDWRNENGLWKTVIDNTFFGDYNPYATTIDGDWLIRPIDKFLHTGMVYINEQALTEVTDKKDLVENSWYCEVLESKTMIYIASKALDLSKDTVEINVRKTCFYPKNIGVNNITVRGFEMSQAATTWAPPTTEQFGIIGTHWSKGWIIEENIIHDSRCCGISVGKEISTNDNPYTKYHRKSGYQYQLETVFNALRAGWTKEKIGSHIIRNNTIYDCGQTGIVGNHGGAFSEIYGNHIYNIGNKEEFFGYEIAGIKLHAAIDTYIHNNVIHGCFLGLWLDWEAQGVRVSSNIFCDNIDKDFWFEVTHGPFIVDNNVFGSKRNFTNCSQGGAYINNLFCGNVQHFDVRDRATPYHLPHSTEVAGCANVYGGDIRCYNNIYCGTDEEGWTTGNSYYNGSPTSLDEYIKNVLLHGRGDIETFKCEKQPVYIDNNFYLDDAKPFDHEETRGKSNRPSNVSVKYENKKVTLKITLPEEFDSFVRREIDSNMLGKPRICECAYEDAKGNPIEINSDMYGIKIKTVGPLSELKSGENEIVL